MLSSTSLAQTAPTQQAAPVQQAAPTQEAAAAASADGVPAASVGPPFAPGAKLFLEPMDGFDQFLSRAFAKKKVPVVVVLERADADFVVSGDTRLKKPNFITGMVLANRGKGSISIKDARTGNVVFANKFNRVDQMTADYYIYEGWANSCAKHLKKAMEKK
jgi:hypothetical protein